MDKYYFFDTKKENHRVTDKYVSIIRETLELLGKDCEDLVKLPPIHNGKRKGIVAIDSLHVLKAKFSGYDSIIYWVQGVLPEESYMRRKSKLRRLALSILEKKALKSAKFVIYVSEAMYRHYQNKYDFSPVNYYIMPCFSSDLGGADVPDNYRENVFLYSGGMAVWQCFPETVDLYKRIEDRTGGTQLLVMTSEQDKARKILEDHGVRNYNIGYAEGEVYRKEIRKCKFGFCLRKNEVVNHVATPTKYSDYISNGIIPIFSSNTEDFYKKSRNSGYCLCIENDGFWDRLDDLVSRTIKEIDVMESFKSNFGEYYSSTYHIRNMAEAFNKAGV